MTAGASGVEGTTAGLVERAAHGDGDAFDAIARSLGDAQDATQDALIKA